MADYGTCIPLISIDNGNDLFLYFPASSLGYVRGQTSSDLVRNPRESADSGAVVNIGQDTLAV